MIFNIIRASIFVGLAYALAFFVGVFVAFVIVKRCQRRDEA